MTRTTSLVLDTSCVRGTSRGALQLLKQRGFQLHVSGIALLEMTVHFTGTDEYAIKQQERLRPRMRFLTELCGGVVPLAASHGPLLRKLGGRLRGQEDLTFEEWNERAQATWREFAALPNNPTPGVAFGEGSAQYVEETGDDYLSTMGAAAALGEATEMDLLIFKKLYPFAPSIADDMDMAPNSPPARELFDAYLRTQMLHAMRASARASGKMRAAEANDAMDLNMLQHLADGLLLITKDYLLIETVDESESFQAPWVRTVGEVLLGHYPQGLPRGDSARDAMREHTPRTRAMLKESDEQGELIVKAWLKEGGAS